MEKDQKPEHCHKCEDNNRRCFQGVNAVYGNDTKLKALSGFIAANFTLYQCNINYIIDTLSFSHAELNMLTYKYFSCSPKRLLENLRLEKALFLLQEGIPVIRVALSCGYNELRPFQKAFHKRFNNNPKLIKNTLTKLKNREEQMQKLLDNLWEPEIMTCKKDM